jgi:uncharacterized damage-inducible protein DinB
MKAEDLQTIYQYNQWANNKVLRQVAKLTPEQLNTPNNLTGGSLFETLIHAYDSEWSWRLVAQEGAMPGKVLTAEDFPDFPTLRKTWNAEMETMLTFVETLEDDGLHETHEFIWSPRARPRQRTLWHILFHAANHSTHHRAEIGRYLDTLGHSPKDMDFMIWSGRYAKPTDK